MKKLMRNYIADAVLLILLGLVLLFKPGGTLEFFCKLKFNKAFFFIKVFFRFLTFSYTFCKIE